MFPCDIGLLIRKKKKEWGNEFFNEGGVSKAWIFVSEE
jgi:hypothetical protein